MKPIRLLLADDHEIIRAGLCSLLERRSELEVVGEVEKGKEAVTLATRLLPDVVLMDLNLPDMNGIEATRRIKALNQDVNVLALTTHEDEAYFFETLNAGASGYVPKRTVPDDLVTAIHVVATGEIFLHPIVAGALVRDYLRRVHTGMERESYDELSPYQWEMLTHIAEGLSDQDIGSQLGISAQTVRQHRGDIFRQLNLHNRADLIEYALHKGWIYPSKAA